MTPDLHLHGTMNWAVPYHPVMDVIRVFVMALAAIELLWLVRIGMIRPRDHSNRVPFDPNPSFTRWCFQAIAGACLLSIAQEVAQFGHAMIWWRLPLILFIMIAGARALRVRL